MRIFVLSLVLFGCEFPLDSDSTDASVPVAVITEALTVPTACGAEQWAASTCMNEGFGPVPQERECSGTFRGTFLMVAGPHHDLIGNAPDIHGSFGVRETSKCVKLSLSARKYCATTGENGTVVSIGTRWYVPGTQTTNQFPICPGGETSSHHDDVTAFISGYADPR